MTPFKRRFGKYFYAWLYHLSGWRETSTNNYGFHPVDPDVQAAAGEEAHQIQLYREMARAVPDAEWPSLRALEVGCGRGGGLVRLDLLLRPREMVGLDFAGRAVAVASKLARRHAARATFLRGDAMQLPFPAERFDVVMNVESSHIYADQGRFLHEVARVLRPGGRLLIADYRSRADGLAALHTDLAAAGFRVVADREITEQVTSACRADTASNLTEEERQDTVRDRQDRILAQRDPRPERKRQAEPESVPEAAPPPVPIRPEAHRSELEAREPPLRVRERIPHRG